MGVFENSKFIWFEKEGSIDSYGEFLPSLSYFGGECVFRISCDGDYTLFINGAYVSSNQYGDFESYKSYDEIDISSYLVKGENKLSILVWHFGDNSQRYKKYKAGVIFEALIGGQVALASNLDTPSRKKLTDKMGIVSSVPVLASGVFNSKEEILSFLGNSNYISEHHIESLRALATRLELDVERQVRETDPSRLMEGLYIKVEENGLTVDRLKYVRQGFIQAVMESGSHWQSRPIIPNLLKDGNIYGGF